MTTAQLKSDGLCCSSCTSRLQLVGSLSGCSSIVCFFHPQIFVVSLCPLRGTAKFLLPLAPVIFELFLVISVSSAQTEVYYCHHSQHSIPVVVFRHRLIIFSILCILSHFQYSKTVVILCILSHFQHSNTVVILCILSHFQCS